MSALIHTKTIKVDGLSVRYAEGGQDHQRLPNAHVDLIAGAGHFCWEEKPAEYAALLTSWWDRANAASKS